MPKRLHRYYGAVSSMGADIRTSHAGKSPDTIRANPHPSKIATSGAAALAMMRRRSKSYRDGPTRPGSELRFDLIQRDHAGVHVLVDMAMVEPGARIVGDHVHGVHLRWH